MSLLVDIPSTEGEVRKDLEPGDYYFEIIPHKEPGQAVSTFNKKDDAGNLTNEPETKYFNWPLKVLEGPFTGQIFYHRTMVWASPSKIAQAKNIYNPYEAFTLSFLNDIGICDESKDGKASLKSGFIGKDRNGKPALKIDKVYGIQFWGRIAYDKTGNFINLTKVWQKKPSGSPKNESLEIF